MRRCFITGQEIATPTLLLAIEIVQLRVHRLDIRPTDADLNFDGTIVGQRFYGQPLYIEAAARMRPMALYCR